MAECLNCGKELEQIEGSRERKYCDDKCRMAFNRSRKRTESGLESEQNEESERIESEQIKSEQVESGESEQPGYELVSGKVYGRRAVVFFGLDRMGPWSYMWAYPKKLACN